MSQFNYQFDTTTPSSSSTSPKVSPSIRPIEFGDNGGFIKDNDLDDIIFISPNDNDEFSLPDDKMLDNIDQLEIPHYLNRQLWNANFISPIHDILSSRKRVHVLDVGCGKGTWILDMSLKYPFSIFIGIDRSPIFPSQNNIKQLNATFLYLNLLEKALPYDNNTFDFVHLRYLNLNLLKVNWSIIINKLINVLKNSSNDDIGYIEICEWDLVTFNNGPVTKKLFKSVQEYLISIGIEPIISKTLEQILKEKPDELTDITIQKKFFPIGNWSRIKARKQHSFSSLNIDYNNSNLKEFLKILNNFKPHLSNYMGMDDKKFDNMIKDFIKEVDSYKTFGQETRIYARKI
ncbi:24029_t:CDS:2 [Entrophospora sp. SA101]|nr:24029_t:CDS:2 [Entrophospora sp. SA101]